MVGLSFARRVLAAICFELSNHINGDTFDASITIKEFRIRATCTENDRDFIHLSVRSTKDPNFLWLFQLDIDDGYYWTYLTPGTNDESLITTANLLKKSDSAQWTYKS